MPLMVNQTAKLRVVKLPYTEELDPENPADLLHTLGSTELVAADKVSGWQVNGESANAGGGNGWVTGAANNEKDYHAPADVPTNNPVAVSATVNTGKGNVILVSNIRIIKQNYFEFTCGQTYQDLEGMVTGSTSAGTYYLFMMSRDNSSQHQPALVLEIGEGFHGAGTYAFNEKTLLACSVTAWPYEWKSEYYELNSSQPKFGGGSVTINNWPAVGQVVTGTIEGTLHYQEWQGTQRIHKTSQVSAKFSYIREQ